MERSLQSRYEKEMICASTGEIFNQNKDMAMGACHPVDQPPLNSGIIYETCLY